MNKEEEEERRNSRGGSLLMNFKMGILLLVIGRMPSDEFEISLALMSFTYIWKFSH